MKTIKTNFWDKVILLFKITNSSKGHIWSDYVDEFIKAVKIAGVTCDKKTPCTYITFPEAEKIKGRAGQHVLKADFIYLFIYLLFLLSLCDRKMHSLIKKRSKFFCGVGGLPQPDFYK